MTDVQLDLRDPRWNEDQHSLRDFETEASEDVDVKADRPDVRGAYEAGPGDRDV